MSLVHFMHGLLDKEAQGAGEQVSRVAASHAVDVLGGGTNAEKLLHGIAAVESRYGAHPNTYRPGYHGGMFQVDRTGFQATKDVAAHPGLRAMHAEIRRRTGKSWPSMTWRDLRTPVNSALAARMLLRLKPEDIPATRQGRAEYWKKHYNTPAGKGTVQDYLDKSNPDFSAVPRPVRAEKEAARGPKL